jgi:predicted PurR-regulated permease PerM
MLSPDVESVDRMIPPRISRNWSLLIVYLAFISALIGIGFVVGSTVVEQASSLAVRLPELIKSKDPLQGFALPGWLDPLRLRIVETIRSQLDNLDKSAIPILKTAAGEVFKHAGTALEVVLVPILSFFFLKDGRRIREALVDHTTDSRSTLLLGEILDEVHLLLGHYMRALVILACATFVSYMGVGQGKLRSDLIEPATPSDCNLGLTVRQDAVPTYIVTAGLRQR